ncbi:sigma-70 family RNA polymerase sigma factor [Desulfallas sp. Bu1-1]|uniref:sigma-70 family RNA polymerase sigma factor n=1 Tax=Desulfallas sp. Bu1-1 TaxID=2787620 RepID=UPI00189D59C5|nr:sigma-70 family RNA polymerase sigma factor [Desulfallas sp. Bu1-1]MBF7081850.1 sigma-70 family RNA polymerase sigma factor [Desulfallas sp. Bu1-1]
MDFLKQALIEKAISEYVKRGYVTEDFILDLVGEYDLPLSEISRVCEHLVAKGIIIRDNNVHDTNSYDKDYSQIDYNQTFNEVVTIDEGLTVFIDYVRNIQPPQWREAQYLLPLAKNGNPYAKQRIIEMYMRIAIRIALSFHKKYGFPLADTIQESCLGLMIALDKYEPDSHDKFSTYFPWWIRQVIVRELSVGNPIFYFPAHVSERLLVVYKVKENHYCIQCENGSICTALVFEVVNKLKCPEDEALQLIQYIEPYDSIKQLTDKNELLFCDHGVFESEMCDYIENSEFRSIIADVIDSLSFREKEVLQYRFGFLNNEPMTLEQIGGILGLTRERIRQIEAKAINKLRHPSRIKVLKNFY